MKVIKHSTSLLTGIFVLVTLIGLWVFINTDYFDQEPIMTNPPNDAVYLDAERPITERVADLLSYMTLDEKVGQMALVENNNLKNLNDIAKYHLGALLSGSGSKPATNTSEGWQEVIAEYQKIAKGSRLGIPLLYGSDAIHGHAHVESATVFPHAIGLGATNNKELVEAVAQATAEELFATGVNWSFSPNLDQPSDIRWGRVYEAYSDDPQLVEELGVAYLKGLQTNPILNNEEVFILGTTKHFLGLGSMGWGTSLNKNFQIDQGVTPKDSESLRSRYLPPFTRAIESGALSIMVGLNTWGDKRMVLQKELLTDVLKTDLGFKGFVVSDWYGIHEGRKNTFWASVQAINAGVDMAMLPFAYESFAKEIKWANRLGLISDERIDEAVSRILYAKFALGLFDEKRATSSVKAIPNVTNQVLAKKAVTESLVLLKNKADLLPLSTDTEKILVAGSAADNVGQQLGAWSIEWQGVDGNWPKETISILGGIKKSVSRGTVVEYDRLGNFATGTKKAPVGIAVVGEKPYAEGWGDTEYPILSPDDLLAIKNLQAQAEKVVVIIIAGRPLFLSNEVDSFDALVMAWLPGSRGDGVASGLFGETPFTGTLPLPWPSSSQQLPVKVDGTTANNTTVLFPRYFGLKLESISSKSINY